ncbi:MAG: hypothetical protein VKJ24_21995 [Synechococcales bacterium]|nr:hypothetical protein [Synechococcales bacterium]
MISSLTIALLLSTLISVVSHAQANLPSRLKVKTQPAIVQPARVQPVVVPQQGMTEKASLGQPENAASQNALCFYEQSNGQVLDLSRLCGAQDTHKTSLPSVNQPANSPYNYELIKQYDEQLYGQAP